MIRLRALSGFTLIELSIVFVIVGLIVGGVLVGRDLVKAAEVRSTLAQIEKYNQAANTFRGKYGYLPGDIKDPEASSFGFIARGPFRGMGDGNGIIEGIFSAIPTGYQGIREDCGETAAFWDDLAAANLISGTFSPAYAFSGFPSLTLTSSPSLRQWIPAAQLGGGNFIYVWSGGSTVSSVWASNSVNYFGLSAITSIPPGTIPQGQPGLTVQQAYSMDKKVDDGLPQTGNVTAQYVDSVVFGSDPHYGWAGSGGITGGPYTTATTGSGSTCFDNGGGTGPQQYSVEISGGSNLNCALSFRFQ